ncbi:hypothetical protein DENSPDRAFT_886570 [Dentipellis sp. KUC8613]|nr:hypothetical protein DENSPDRAFT_886570 [Dentipellis sp. KUC8613]
MPPRNYPAHCCCALPALSTAQDVHLTPSRSLSAIVLHPAAPCRMLSAPVSPFSRPGPQFACPTLLSLHGAASCHALVVPCRATLSQATTMPSLCLVGPSVRPFPPPARRTTPFSCLLDLCRPLFVHRGAISRPAALQRRCSPSFLLLALHPLAPPHARCLAPRAPAPLAPISPRHPIVALSRPLSPLRASLSGFSHAPTVPTPPHIAAPPQHGHFALVHALLRPPAPPPHHALLQHGRFTPVCCHHIPACCRHTPLHPPAAICATHHALSTPHRPLFMPDLAVCVPPRSLRAPPHCLHAPSPPSGTSWRCIAPIEQTHHRRDRGTDALHKHAVRQLAVAVPPLPLSARAVACSQHTTTPCALWPH